MPTWSANNIAEQLERRISYQRAMKRAIQQAIRQGAEGIPCRSWRTIEWCRNGSCSEYA